MFAGRLLSLSLLALSAGAGCQSSSGGTGGGAACTYEQTVPCKGPGDCSGTQTCLPDLSAYGACECGDGGGDASTDAAAEASGDSG